MRILLSVSLFRRGFLSMVLPTGNTKTETWVQAKIPCNSVNIQYKNTSQKLTRATHKYEGKSLNNRNVILKCMEKYAQRKILFRDTKWLLSNMPFRGRDDRAVRSFAIARTTWPLYCQLAPWKSN